MSEIKNHLHLDGVHSFNKWTKILNTSCPCICGHICRRLLLPAHAAVALVEMVVKQGVRGTMMLTSGMLTFNWERIKFGLIDLISIVVQLAALPILALIAFAASPHLAEVCATKMQKQFNQKMDEEGVQTLQVKQPGKESSNASVREIQHDNDTRVTLVCRFLERATLPIQIAVQTVTQLAHHILAFGIECESEIAWGMASAPYRMFQAINPCYQIDQEIKMFHGFVSA